VIEQTLGQQPCEQEIRFSHPSLCEVKLRNPHCKKVIAICSARTIGFRNKWTILEGWCGDPRIGPARRLHINDVLHRVKTKKTLANYR
jgi:hypothetical protein